MNHTKTPYTYIDWSVTGPTAAADMVAQGAVKKFDNGIAAITVAQVKNTGQDVICTVYGVRKEIAEANAAFIVRACNAHYELLEALQGVLRVADRDTDEFNAARAAIAKATGEQP